MKPKHFRVIAIITLVLSSPIVLIGALFKLQHWNGAGEMLIAGLASEVLGVLILVYSISLESKERQKNLSENK